MTTVAMDSNTPDDPSYAPFLRGVANVFAERAEKARALFTVDTSGLWDEYISAFPEPERQHYTCSCCRQFIERYGGIVVVEDDGTRSPVCWDREAVPSHFAPIADRLSDTVARRPVAAAFVAKAGTLGTPVTGRWTHLAAELPTQRGYADRVLTPNQRAAAIRENVLTVTRALEEFPADALSEALRVLEADALSRSEKFVGPVRWLLDLQTRRAATKDERKREAILWRAVATAPEGFSHPRASVVGPLLEGIIAGKSFETLRDEFAAMLHPLRYQRPQAAPTAGNIREAERLVETLGLAPAFERRFARLDECETVWTPVRFTDAPARDGIFSHLTPKDTAPLASGVQLPAQTMTWDKFRRTILPTAARIELSVPVVGPFIALTTATNADAPMLIRWDREEQRNPVAWYVYHNGSPARQWGLTPGWCAVTGIVPLPNLWGTRPAPQHGEGVVLTLAGAVDSTINSLALFPELLRDDLHGIRATVEAFSRTKSITGGESASACGYDLRKSTAVRDCTLRVTVDGRATTYRIDRWD